MELIFYLFSFLMLYIIWTLFKDYLHPAFITVAVWLVIIFSYNYLILTRLSTYFVIDSYIEGFIKIRNIQGLLTVIIFSFTWVIIKPLLWILNKFNREEDFKKIQDKMIKKYLLKKENIV